jgi:hypothetical protein
MLMTIFRYERNEAEKEWKKYIMMGLQFELASYKGPQEVKWFF